MPAQPDRPRTELPRSRGRSSRRWGSLRGGAGVGIVAGSAALGAAATIAMRAQPGRVLGACIVVGTVIAALAVRPRSGRLIFPVPILSYLIAALIAGIAYNRSSSKTELVIGAAQWVASGFFPLTLATILAIVLVTARWLLARRNGRASAAADWPGPADETSHRPQAGRTREAGEAGAEAEGPAQRTWTYPDQRTGTYPDQRTGTYPDQRPAPRYGQNPGQRNGPYPDQRNEPHSDQRYGQYPEQPPDRRYGQYPEQPPGRRNGPDPDRRNGQDTGQAPDQWYGQYPGRRGGRSPGQGSGPYPDQGYRP